MDEWWGKRQQNETVVEDIGGCRVINVAEGDLDMSLPVEKKQDAAGMCSGSNRRWRWIGVCRVTEEGGLKMHCII